MKKIFILLFIFFGSSLFADTDWFIYTYNDVSSIADIMRFLSFVDQDSTYQNILYLAIVFGFFMAAFMKKVFNVEAMGIQMLSVVGLMAFIFGARTDVHIVNVKTFSSMQEGKSYEKVANVPFAFAFTGSTLSNIGYSMARLLNNGIGHVNGDKYSELSFIKSGMLGGSDIYAKILKTELGMMSEKGAAFQNYYNSYLKQCAIGRGMAYTDDMVDILKNSKDLMTDIDPLNIMGKTGVDIRPDLVDFPTGRVSCNDAYLATLNEYNSFKNSGEIEEYFKKQFKDKFENPTEVVSAVTQVYGLQNGASSADNIRQFSLAAGMMGQVNSALSAYLGDGMSDAAMLYGGFGAGLSNASLIQSGMSKSFYSGQQLPYLMEILNFVMYALFPFVFVATIASAQLKILKNFFLAMLWIQLWPVTFEALAYFINKDMIYAATSSLVAAGAGHVTEDNILTMSLLPHLNEAIASQSAQAANLMWSVPIISGFLLSGSWTALMGMASNIGAHSAAAANTADLQRKQAEMAFEQKLLQDTNNAWTPTASQMARAGIDAELLGTAKTSNTALAEIEKLGGVGNAITTAAQSGALQSLSEQTKLSHLSDSDYVTSGYREAVDTQIANQTATKNITESGGEDNYTKNASNAKVFDDQGSIATAQKLLKHFDGDFDKAINSTTDSKVQSELTSMYQNKILQDHYDSIDEAARQKGYTDGARDLTNIQKTSMLIDRLDGLDNMINSVATAGSYDEWSKTNKSLGHEDAFNGLYAEFGGGRTKDEFLAYMATEAGRDELAKGLGAARVIERTTNSELISSSEGDKKVTIAEGIGKNNADVTEQEIANAKTTELEEKIASSNAKIDVSREKDVSIKDAKYLSETVDYAVDLGKTVSRLEVAKTLNPDMSNTTALFNQGQNEGRIFTTTDADGKVINGAFNANFDAFGKYSSDGSVKYDTSQMWNSSFTHNQSKTWDYSSVFKQTMTADFTTSVTGAPGTIIQAKYNGDINQMLNDSDMTKGSIIANTLAITPGMRDAVLAIYSSVTTPEKDNQNLETTYHGANIPMMGFVKK